MRTYRHIRTISVITFIGFVLAALPALSQEVRVRRTANKLEMANDLMTRALSYSETSAAGIYPSSLVLARSGKQMINAAPEVNWFECYVEDQRITNRDNRWVFENHSTRNLANGGVELHAQFTYAAEQFRSLRLEILLQMFPDEALSREKIILSSVSGVKYKLTALALGPRMVFPAYMLTTSQAATMKIVTLRLAQWGKELIESPGISTFDEHALEEGTRVGRNLSQNYMYHPSEATSAISAGQSESSAGPVVFAMNPADGTGIMMAYEHGSPDGDSEQEYIHIKRSLGRDGVVLQTEYRNGIYAKGQFLSPEMKLESPWVALGFFDGRNVDNGRRMLWHYLSSSINETGFARIPHFYYNTWGMQRDEERRGKDVRLVLTRERVMEEINAAAKLNVDLFVLDDGWQDKFGDWNPDSPRFGNSLRWYVDALRQRNIMPGLWIATLATDSAAMITRQHPEWLIRDEAGKPIVARWGMNYFCFDSDYRDCFIRKCKERIDEGIRYFKWDGIDKHLCTSPLHHHGDASVSSEERKLKQGYDLPLLVADAIRELKSYQPDVVIEVDVTEPLRSVGLAILSEGKYFWMNNGASAYGDYSTHRSRSNRFISNLYHQYIPPTLLTFANYPHNNTLYSSYRANVNSSLTGGRGFWGNLALMSGPELDRVGAAVAKARLVMNDLSDVRPVVTGSVGSSPEIYEWVNRQKVSGQVVGFSGSACVSDYVVREIAGGKVLAVLNNAYSIGANSLTVHFEFGWPDASREAFVLPNNGSGISIVSSTSWIDHAEVVDGTSLRFTNGAPGNHVIDWPAGLGEPVARGNKEFVQKSRVGRIAGGFRIELETRLPQTEIEISGK